MNWSTTWNIRTPELSLKNDFIIDNLHNPTILTFECNVCEKELDINTTSFSKLMAAAKAQNWLVKFNDVGYTVHCDRCKEKE
jgi:hypothetical protein